MPNPDSFLLEAIKVGEQDREVFDWPDALGALNKVKEELHELEVEMFQNDTLKINEEFSDLLFTLLQVARHLKVDPVKSLDFAIFKYKCRSVLMFDLISKDQKKASDLSLEDLEKYWQQAKKISHKKIKEKSSFYFSDKRPN